MHSSQPLSIISCNFKAFTVSWCSYKLLLVILHLLCTTGVCASQSIKCVLHCNNAISPVQIWTNILKTSPYSWKSFSRTCFDTLHKVQHTYATQLMRSNLTNGRCSKCRLGKQVWRAQCKRQATSAPKPSTSNSASRHSEVQRFCSSRSLNVCNKKKCYRCTIMNFTNIQATLKVNNFKILSQQQSLWKFIKLLTQISGLCHFKISKLSQPVIEAKTKQVQACPEQDKWAGFVYIRPSIHCPFKIKAIILLAYLLFLTASIDHPFTLQHTATTWACNYIRALEPCISYSTILYSTSLSNTAFWIKFWVWTALSNEMPMSAR